MRTSPLSVILVTPVRDIQTEIYFFVAAGTDLQNGQTQVKLKKAHQQQTHIALFYIASDEYFLHLKYLFALLIVCY